MLQSLNLTSELCELCGKDWRVTKSLCAPCLEMLERVLAWRLADFPTNAKETRERRLLPPGRAVDMTEEAEVKQSATAAGIGFDAAERKGAWKFRTSYYRNPIFP